MNFTWLQQQNNNKTWKTKSGCNQVYTEKRSGHKYNLTNPFLSMRLEAEAVQGRIGQVIILEEAKWYSTVLGLIELDGNERGGYYGGCREIIGGKTVRINA